MSTPTNTYGFYLVWNPEGYSPKKRHATKAEADTEARRLSSLNPDKSFYVLKTTEVFRTRTEVIKTNYVCDTHFDHESPKDVKYLDGSTFGNRLDKDINWMGALGWRMSVSNY